MALLTCENVSLAYEKRIVLQELTFSLETGNYLCIIGENGSGKSTLVKAILSLKTPVAGKIVIGEGLKQTEIGYLPQQTNLQRDFPASVWEVVLSGCLNARGLRPFYAQDEKRKALSNMEKLGILEIKDSCYRQLSVGQQQRVLLARALCATKKLLILDEPVAGLDPMSTQEFYHLLRAVNRDGITIVMVSHDIESSIKYASHILHLENKPIFFGPIDMYLKSKERSRLMGVTLHD